MNPLIYCACGRPLHYSDPAKRLAVEQQISGLGPDVPVRSGNRTWIVPRHFIALHGLKAVDLPRLRFPELFDTEILMPYLHERGGMRVKLGQKTADFREQFYSHVDPDDGKVRHFDISKLRRLIKDSAVEIGQFEITAQQVEFVRQTHEIDQTHVSDRLSDSALNEPGIVCLFADNTQLIVDGHHRLVARAARQMDIMDFHLVPETMWRRVLLRLPSEFDVVQLSTSIQPNPC